MTTASVRHRYGSLSADDVAALDAAALDLGVAIEQLMEVAGLQVARLAWRMLGRRPADVRVVAGRGHNGGDGVVAARHLSSWGCMVSVEVLARRDRLDALMAQQCGAAAGAGVSVRCEGEPAPGNDGHAALTIDAVLGTGMRGELRADIAAHLRAMRPPILSIDVPSGLDATTGAAPAGTVHATATMTLGGCKQGLWSEDARRWTGALYTAAIGMPPAAWTRAGLHPPAALRGGQLVRVPPPA